MILVFERGRIVEHGSFAGLLAGQGKLVAAQLSPAASASSLAS